MLLILSDSLPLAWATPVILPPLPSAIRAAAEAMISLSSRKSSTSTHSANSLIATESSRLPPVITTSTPCSSASSIAIGSRLSSTGISTSLGVSGGHGSKVKLSYSISLLEPHLAANSYDSSEYPLLTRCDEVSRLIAPE